MTYLICPKIDDEATDGLAGVNNSLAYRTHEIEKHFHSYERWGGKDTSPDGENQVVAWTGADAMNPFVSTSGNDTFGSWIQVIGPNDTPVQTGMVKYDFHRILITDVSAQADTDIHKIQISVGATGDAGIAAEEYTEFMFTPLKGGRNDPIPFHMERTADGSKVWVRHWVDGENAQTMNLFIGLHEYPG